jgi:glucan-binding YG repeat protein
MAIKLETLEAVREKMKSAPEVAKEKRTVSKQESIKELKREIEAMQKKGYTLDDIAKFMTDGGIQITTPTLKSYLQRTKPAKTTTQRKESKKPEISAESKTETQQKTTTDKTQQSEIKGQFKVNDDSEI